jgi:hypothetical protein
MSKSDPELADRLRDSGATPFERRLLEAAGREQPSQELSERMARAIGISLPGAGGVPTTSNAAAHGPAAAAPKATTASGSLFSWVTGTIVTGAVLIGAFVALRSSSAPVTAPPSALTGALPSAAKMSTTPGPTEPQPTTPSTSPVSETSAAPRQLAPSAQGRERAAAGDLSDQLALVDAAHRALAGGDASGALALARKYSSEYPSGTFRPEAAAIRIEALVKLGRSGEARALANKFATSYGPGPLADRMATVVGSSSP